MALPGPLPGVVGEGDGQGRTPSHILKRRSVAHAHPDCHSHLSCRPQSWFSIRWHEPPREGVVGRQEDGLAGRTFCSFMCFASFSVIDLAGPVTTVGAGLSVGSAVTDLSPDLEAD